MELHERVHQLFEHHGIERAHFIAGGLVHHLIELAVAAPDLVASVTLVCPHRLPLTLASDLSMPLNIVSGDRGRASEMVDHVLSNVAKPDRVALSDYEPMLWNDIALERTSELLDGIAGFLTRVDRRTDLAIARPVDGVGMVSELPYRSDGVGRPVVLFPLGLAPSQWGPLVERLRRQYAVISVTGVHTPPTSILEERASTPGYQSMLQSIVDRLELAPNTRLVEVGCGCGDGFDYDAGGGGRRSSARRDGPGNSARRQDRGCGAGARYCAHRRGRPAECDSRQGGPILNAAGVGQEGCADASLYRRMADAGVTNVFAMPQFNPSLHLLFKNQGRSGLDELDATEREVWVEAVEAAGDAFFIAQPMHVAVGTKPFR